MKTYISILRGINVGGKRKLKMDELKALYRKLGFSEVSSYIQSGNVVFQHQEEDPAHLARMISNAIEENFQLNVPVIIRSAQQMQKLLSENPFLANSEESQLHLTFLSEIPADEASAALKAFSAGNDQFELVQDHVFIVCQGKYHQSKLSNAFFEKKLGVQATTRNWKTVKKLAEMASQSEMTYSNE